MQQTTIAAHLGGAAAIARTFKTFSVGCEWHPGDLNVTHGNISTPGAQPGQHHTSRRARWACVRSRTASGHVVGEIRPVVTSVCSSALAQVRHSANAVVLWLGSEFGTAIVQDLSDSRYCSLVSHLARANRSTLGTEARGA